MLGIILLLLNNHRKFVDTVHNLKFTTKSVGEARKNGNKYFYDRQGFRYDINSGNRVCEWYDKYTGHRGIIDTTTGKVVEDYIEQSVDMLAQEFYDETFCRIKERLDERKKCLAQPHDKKDVLSYSVHHKFCNEHYTIYWSEEEKRWIEITNNIEPYRPNEAKHWIKEGYSEEEIYEYYHWMGIKVKYPLPLEDYFTGNPLILPPKSAYYET